MMTETDKMLVALFRPLRVLVGECSSRTITNTISDCYACPVDTASSHEELLRYLRQRNDYSLVLLDGGTLPITAEDIAAIGKALGDVPVVLANADEQGALIVPERMLTVLGEPVDTGVLNRIFRMFHLRPRARESAPTEVSLG